MLEYHRKITNKQKKQREREREIASEERRHFSSSMTVIKLQKNNFTTNEKE